MSHLAVAAFFCLMELVFSVGRIPDQCSKPPEYGPCRALKTTWTYNYTTATCERYRSCEATGNSFDSETLCKKSCRDPHYGTCGGVYNQTYCKSTEKARVGEVWFDPDSRTCVDYAAGQCYHGHNVFQSKRRCYSRCAEFVKDPCLLPIVPVRCSYSHKEHRYSYNTETKRCEKFFHGNCNGNQNSFRSRKDCFLTCSNKSACLKTRTQSNHLFHEYYYYDVNTDDCKRTITWTSKSVFWPDDNRFKTAKKCMKECVPYYKS